MSEYQECMTRAMQNFPKGITREERGLLFCANAKVCSGKQPNVEAAKKYCLENPAAPKISSGRRRGSGTLNAEAIGNCMYPDIQRGVSIKELIALLSSCSNKLGVGGAGVKIKKPETKKHFIKVCAMNAIVEQGLKGTFAESVKLQKQCELQWKEKEATPDGISQ